MKSQNSFGSDSQVNDDEEFKMVCLSPFITQSKTDQQIEQYDQQINELEGDDLEVKMQFVRTITITSKQTYRITPNKEIPQGKFKKNLVKPIQPSHGSILSLAVSSSNSIDRIPVRRSRQNNTLNSHRSRLGEAQSPSKNRYHSRKQSQFSQIRKTELVVTNVSHQQMQEHSFQMINPANTKLTSVNNELTSVRKNSSKLQHKQSIDKIEQAYKQSKPKKSASHSSLASPKSILKSNGSSMLDISRVSSQSRLSFQSLQINQSPQKYSRGSQPPRRVRFSLTRKQAKKENIEF